MRTDGPVVIAIDGSVHSEQTLTWGLREAELRGARAVVAEVCPPVPVGQWGWYPVVTDLEGDLADEARAHLATLATREQARRPGLALETRLLRGPEVPQLQSLTEEAQLLVVGGHLHNGRGRVGRVAAHLAAHARCPVAVVRPGAAHPGGGVPPVVVGVDGSACAEEAVAVAAHEALLRGAPLVLAHARPSIVNPYGVDIPGLPSLTDPQDPTHRAAAATALALRADHPGLEVRVHLVDDQPAHALVEAGRGAQLLVVGSRGLGAFAGMLLGSVSNAVVRDATTTVLVARATASTGAASAA
ncbi:universal stress protein UspA [Actinomycetota bacterium]|nr:universal stress protein UspA [Actinomycetota bacterium]